MAEYYDKNPVYGDTPVDVTQQHVYNEDVHFVDEHERKDLARGLKQRHVQMIAIAGAIVCCTFFPYVFTSLVHLLIKPRRELDYFSGSEGVYKAAAP
jgi:hypothetical protein